MKTVNEILAHIDGLIRESRLSEVESYMNSELENARSEKAYDVAITLLNEMCGFFRDTGKMSKAIDCCLESEKLMDDMGIGKTKERAAAYINTANVYRAEGSLDKSYDYFEKAYEILEICGDDQLYSSYYNNLSLLHQNADRFEDSVECLKKALYIADQKLGDEIRVAISRTNLASSLLQLKRADEAREYLEPAIKIFAGRTPSDFHYSAALSAMGDMCLVKGELDKATEYFEEALSEIEMHMGQNNFYSIVSDNLESVYKMQGGKPVLTGLELCERYFKAFGEPVLRHSFGELLEHIGCGLAGEGSESLGFDDKISPDHDFGPGFCIWVDDTVSEADIDRLNKFYSLLPKTYMGVKRLETRQGAGRVGVIKIADYLKKVTGFDHIPRGIQEWQYTVDENLIMGVNGKIFMDEGGLMGDLRKRLRTEQPMYVFFRKLGVELELMAKHGQYGYPRAISRGDLVAASMSKNDFIRATMRACHILKQQYAPYAKWLHRSMKELKGFEEVTELIEKLCLEMVAEDGKAIEMIENICDLVRIKLYGKGLSQNPETYLAVQAAEIEALANRTMIADAVVDAEWALFDKTNNVGGRAGCQDDWSTFSIMRRSQYYTWPADLLKTVYVDFSEAIKSGRNVISEKYGFMMESTAPDEFEKIKGMLPELSDKKKQLIEAIVEIQVAWMEEFAKEYPKLATNARVIHTSEDSLWMTSYETYLRGELSTYHDDTLELYGRFIVDTKQKGENLAKKIMNMSVFFYGYDSMSEIEGKL